MCRAYVGLAVCVLVTGRAWPTATPQWARVPSREDDDVIEKPTPWF